MMPRARLSSEIIAEVRLRWPAVLGLAVFAVALWSQTQAMVGVFFDDGIYVQLAKSLADGHGYRSMHLPDGPAAVHYPPVYPFLLSLLWRLWPSFPSNVVLFELLDAAALGFAAALIAHHSRKLAIPGWIGGIALAFAFTAFPLLTLIGVRFSEPVFIALVAGALLLADFGSTDRASRAFVIGVLLGFATLTRSIGVAAIGGVVFALWWRGHRRGAMVAGVTAGFMMVPWMMWVASNAGAIDPLLMSNYGTYGQFVGQAGLVGVLGGLDLRAFDPLRRLLLPNAPLIATAIVVTALAATLAVGAWRSWNRSPAIVATMVLYLAIVTLWPYAPDRFVWIVLPYLALLGATGFVFAWKQGRALRWIVASMLGVIALGYLPREVQSVRTRGFALTASVPSDRFGLLAASISQALPPEAVIASDGEALVHLYSGHTTVPVYLFHLVGRDAVRWSTDTTVAYWCRQGVTHVAASAPDQEIVPLFAELESVADIRVRTLMAVAEGPRLMEFACDR